MKAAPILFKLAKTTHDTRKFNPGDEQVSESLLIQGLGFRVEGFEVLGSVACLWFVF